MDVTAVVAGFGLGQVGTAFAWWLTRASEARRFERESEHQRSIWLRDQLVTSATEYDMAAERLLTELQSSASRRGPAESRAALDALGLLLSRLLIIAPPHVQFLAAQLHASLRDAAHNLNSEDADSQAEGRAAIVSCQRVIRNFLLAVREEVRKEGTEVSDLELRCDPYARLRYGMPKTD